MADTIMMIHGMWGGGWCWDNFKRYFEERGFNCKTPYLRHHQVDPDEKAPKGLGGTSLLDYASDLESEIKSYDEKPILMGHSMGGLLSLILSGRGLAKAAVLITPAPPSGINALKPSVLWSFKGPMLKFKWLGFPHRLKFGDAVFAMMHLLPPDEQKLIFEKGVSESGRAAREIGFWLFDWRMASRVKPETVKCPMLIIGAEKDRITPAKVTRKVAEKYSHVAKYKEYPAHAHYIIRESGWEQVAEDISQWLGSLSGEMG
jgi:pimeloyl-ACP methyl ester carboxylesterase